MRTNKHIEAVAPYRAQTDAERLEQSHLRQSFGRRSLWHNNISLAREGEILERLM